MKNKRLAFLLSVLCLVNVILPVKQVFASSVEEQVPSILIEVETDRTTSGQVDVEDEITTPSAIDVAELEALIATAEKMAGEAVIGNTPGCYDILDKMKFDLSIAHAKETLKVVQTQEEVNAAVSRLRVAIKQFEESVIAEESQLDRTTAEALLVEAKMLISETTTGSAIGSCPESAMIALKMAVIKAERELAVANTQNDINQVANNLRIAIKAFKDSLVKPEEGDTNGSGTIDVADLALVAFYYGETSEGTNWTNAQKADVNGDGKVNIDDLAIIANKILSK